MRRDLISRIILILVACTLFLCACSQEIKPEPQPEPPAEEIAFRSTIPVLLNNSSLELTNTYKTDYFRGDGCEFDKDLALLSAALAFSGSTGDLVSSLDSMEFDNQVSFQNDDTEINRCSYRFAHKTIDNYEMIVVYVYGLNYGVEWAGNMTVGAKTVDTRSDHEGFALASQWVYDNLKTYIEENYKDSKLKFWITGFSRGAAISDALACRIIEKKEFNVRQSDIYAYTFEAPTSIDAEYVTEYQCIHNILNKADLVTSMPPTCWGIERPGVEINVYADPDTTNAYLASLVGEGVAMPVFTPDESVEGFEFTTPVELVTVLFDTLTEKGKDPSEVPVSFRDRGSFLSSIQERISYLAKLLMRDSSKALHIVMDGIAKLVEEQGQWAVLGLISEEDGFYDFVKPLLDEAQVEYVDSELKEGCSLVYDAGQNGSVLQVLLFAASSDERISSVKYSVSCHYPEVVYVLLKNYQAE